MEKTDTIIYFTLSHPQFQQITYIYDHIPYFPLSHGRCISDPIYSLIFSMTLFLKSSFQFGINFSLFAGSLPSANMLQCH